MLIEDALAKIGGDVESMWGHKGGGWQFYDPQNPGFSDIVKIEPRMGYWVETAVGALSDEK
jgi:hypothetical protein